MQAAQVRQVGQAGPVFADDAAAGKDAPAAAATLPMPPVAKAAVTGVTSKPPAVTRTAPVPHIESVWTVCNCGLVFGAGEGDGVRGQCCASCAPESGNDDSSLCAITQPRESILLELETTRGTEVSFVDNPLQGFLGVKQQSSSLLPHAKHTLHAATAIAIATAAPAQEKLSVQPPFEASHITSSTPTHVKIQTPMGTPVETTAETPMERPLEAPVKERVLVDAALLSAEGPDRLADPEISSEFPPQGRSQPLPATPHREEAGRRSPPSGANHGWTCSYYCSRNSAYAATCHRCNEENRQKEASVGSHAEEEDRRKRPAAGGPTDGAAGITVELPVCPYGSPWICPYCKGNNSELCGACKQDKLKSRISPFTTMKAALKEVRRKDVRDAEEVGPPWTCPYCKGCNKASAAFCGTCKQEKFDTKKVEEEKKQKMRAEEVKREEARKMAAEAKRQADEAKRRADEVRRQEEEGRRRLEAEKKAKEEVRLNAARRGTLEAARKAQEAARGPRESLVSLYPSLYLCIFVFLFCTTTVADFHHVMHYSLTCVTVSNLFSAHCCRCAAWPLRALIGYAACWLNRCSSCNKNVPPRILLRKLTTHGEKDGKASLERGEKGWNGKGKG